MTDGGVWQCLAVSVRVSTMSAENGKSGLANNLCLHRTPNLKLILTVISGLSYCI